MFKKKSKSAASDKKPKITVKRTVSNNLFMLRMICECAPGMLILRILLSVLYTLANFFSYTYLLRYALNGISAGKSFREIFFFICVCSGAILLLSIVGPLLNSLYFNYKEQDLLRHMRHKVYEKAASVELKCYENTEYYNKFSRAIDESVSRAGNVISSVTGILSMITGFSANFILIFSIDPVLLLFALIPLVTIPLTAVINKKAYQQNMELTPENRKKDYTRRTFYMAEYAKEMRLTDMPALMLQRFTESGGRIVEIIKKYGFTLAALTYVRRECLEVIAPLGATVYAVWQTVGLGAMAYGDCVVVINSIGTIAYALLNFSDGLLRFQDNALYIENLREFLEHEPDITDGEKELPAAGDLVLENVSFRYEGASDYTLRNISMRLGQKEKIAIVGHNGAGKTTLVKLLLRLYDPEGTIAYGGTDIRDFPMREYRDLFAAVMQDCRVFALSVAENVLMHTAGEGDDAVVAEALAKAGLAEKVKGFKHGQNNALTREFDKDGEQLSGGEAQKLAIAHVYTKENRFVILDEPSSALDPIAEHEMYERMKAACADCGMIFISHRLAAAVSADRIYLMENGRIAECGTHEELMAKNGRYAEMFRHQAENYAEVAV